ncbi:unnamed protein product [Rhizoctonia solani]|uniref:Uncharacterized protein n=1 Tax=Rhizoctonia solani TaxID=456999 RepID=A0A8H3DQT5_9AGAM|nr:unnamed protein product [Rhizoctonia solani]
MSAYYILQTSYKLVYPPEDSTAFDMAAPEHSTTPLPLQRAQTIDQQRLTERALSYRRSVVRIQNVYRSLRESIIDLYNVVRQLHVEIVAHAHNLPLSHSNACT